MSTHDAQPGDIYIDDLGKLWRCMGRCDEPTVMFQAVEGYVKSPHVYAGAAVAMPFVPPSPTIERCELRGGINGLMWKGWKRIHRPDADRVSVAATD